MYIVEKIDINLLPLVKSSNVMPATYVLTAETESEISLIRKGRQQFVEKQFDSINGVH